MQAVVEPMTLEHVLFYTSPTQSRHLTGKRVDIRCDLSLKIIKIIPKKFYLLLIVKKLTSGLYEFRYWNIYITKHNHVDKIGYLYYFVLLCVFVCTHALAYYLFLLVLHTRQKVTWRYCSHPLSIQNWERGRVYIKHDIIRN